MIWMSIAVAGPCSTPVPLATFRDDLYAAWSGLRGDDPSEAREAVLAQQDLIACIDQPLTSNDVAAYHRNRALASLLAEDTKGALASTSAARRLAPDRMQTWREDSPEFGSLLDDAPESRAPEELVTTLAARVFTDGRAGARRTPGEPAIVQIFRPDGKPLEGAWLSPRTSTPPWVTFPPQTCTGWVPLDTVVDHVRDANTAYENLDVGGFKSSLESVASELPCIDRVVSPGSAASIHRLEGFRLATLGSNASVVRAFQEAQILDPAYRPSEALVPAGSELDDQWSRAGKAAASPWLPMDAPDGLTLWVDGLRTSSKPATLPSIVQVTGPDGSVVWTRFVPATVPLPPLEALVGPREVEALTRLSPARLSYQTADRRQRALRRRAPTRAVGLTLLAGSLSAFAVTVMARSSFDDPTLRPSLLTRRQQLANGSYAAGVGMLAGGAGLLVASELP